MFDFDDFLNASSFTCNGWLFDLLFRLTRLIKTTKNVSQYLWIRTTSSVRIRKHYFLDQIFLAGGHYFSLKPLLFSALILSWNRAQEFVLFPNKQKSNGPTHLSILKSCLFQDCPYSVLVRHVQKTAQLLRSRTRFFYQVKYEKMDRVYKPRKGECNNNCLDLWLFIYANIYIYIYINWNPKLYICAEPSGSRSKT